MSPHENFSPVAEAFCRVLEKGGSVARGASVSEAPVRVLSYRLDFDYCWATGEGGIFDWIRKVCLSKTHPAVVVLVNDSVPSSRTAAPDFETFDAPDLSSSVTPYDWVVAILSRLCAGRSTGAGTDAVHLQLHIFDPWGSNAPDGTFGSRMLRLLAPGIPGLHLYSATCDNEDMVEELIRSNSPVKNRLLCGQLGGQRLLANLGIGGVGTATTATICPGEEPPWMVDLRARWSNRLTAPERRHSVSNLVAPFLLARGLEVLGGRAKIPDLPDAHLCKALYSLLEAIGLVPAVRPPDDGRGERRREGWWAAADAVVQTDIFRQFETLTVLLVDDHANRGYGSIVQAALTGSSEAPGWSLLVETSPEPLFNRVDRLLGLAAPDREWQVCSDCQGRLRNEIETFDRDALHVLGEGMEFEYDILVLDLRLFGENQRRDEQKFLKRLFDIYHVVVCGRPSGARLMEPLARAAESARMRLSELATRDSKEASRDELGTTGQRPTPPSFATPEQIAGRIEYLALFPLLLAVIDPSLPIVLFSTTRQRGLIELLEAAPNIIRTFAKPAMTGSVPEMSPEDAMGSLVRSLRRALHLHESRCIWKRLPTLDWKGDSPIFETFDPRAREQKAVYNWRSPGPLPQPVSSRADRRVIVGNSEPSLRCRELQSLLASYYIHYIIGQQYFDFLSIPWEFLEGALTPEPLLNNPDVHNPNFSLQTDLHRRNAIACALGYIRHKKAHGHTRPPGGEGEAADLRVGTILEFLFLMDFVESSFHVGTTALPSVKATRDYIWLRHPTLWTNAHLEPRHLTADACVPWIDFAVFVFRWCLDGAADKGGHWVSPPTAEAVKKLVSYRMNRCLQLVNDEIGSRQTLCTIRHVGYSRYVAKTPKGNFVELPKRKVLRPHCAGDECMVEVDSIAGAGAGHVVVKEVARGRPRVQGTVKWFNNNPGCGVIKCPDGAEVNVFSAAIPGGLCTLNQGQAVEFEVVESPMGKQAANVIPV
jgi:CspA family cold shock protein